MRVLRVWASGGDGCRVYREQPGLLEELEPPESPRDFARAMTGQSLVSYGLLDPLVPSSPIHPAQETPRPCTPMKETEVEGTRDLQAPGRGPVESGVGQTSRLQLQEVVRFQGQGADWAAAMGLLEVLQHLQQLSQWVLRGWRQTQDEGRAGRASPTMPVPKAKGHLRSPTHSIPEGDSSHPQSPDGRDLPSPQPVSTEAASVPAFSSRCFSLWVRIK